MIYVLHVNSNIINFMFDGFFKQTEEYIYSNLTENCYLVIRSACGCLRHSRGCRSVNPQYHYLPEVPVFNRCVRKMI